MLLILKFARKKAVGSNAAVKMSTFGRVTSVSPMGNAMQATHACASMPFLQMDSTVSLYSKVGVFESHLAPDIHFNNIVV